MSEPASAADRPSRPTVYVETSVISYLAADPSGDLITRGHQEATRRWWSRTTRWELVVSTAVLREAIRGNHAAALKRLELVPAVRLLQIDADARRLASDLVRRGLFPSKAHVDAEHVAVSAVNGIDYLVTWNLKHIANARVRRRVEDLCRLAGYEPPVICTPEALLES